MKLLVSDVKYSQSPTAIFERAANLGGNTFYLDRPSPVIGLAPTTETYENGQVPVQLLVDKFPELTNDHPAVMAAASRTYARNIQATQRGLVSLDFAPTHILTAPGNSSTFSYIRMRTGEQWLEYIRTLNGTETIFGNLTQYPTYIGPELELEILATAFSTDRFVTGAANYGNEQIVRGSEGVSYTILPDGAYEVTFPPGLSVFRCYCLTDVLILVDGTDSGLINPNDPGHDNDITYFFTNNPEFDLMGNIKWANGGWAGLRYFNVADLKSADIHAIRTTSVRQAVSVVRHGYGYDANLSSSSSQGFNPEWLMLGLVREHSDETRFYYQTSTTSSFYGSTFGGNVYASGRPDSEPDDGLFMHTVVNSVSGGVLRFRKKRFGTIIFSPINTYGVIQTGDYSYGSDGVQPNGRSNCWAVTKLMDQHTHRYVTIDPSSLDTNWRFLDSPFSTDNFDYLDSTISSFKVQWDTAAQELSIVIKNQTEGVDYVDTIADGRVPHIVTLFPTDESIRLLIEFTDSSTFDTGVISTLNDIGRYIRLSGPSGNDTDPPRAFTFA